MEPARARLLIDRFHDAPILIVGDLMLDHFLVGRVTRISPEAPVPVVEFARDEFRPGGAANVANTVRSLGGRPLLVGVVGDDPDGKRLVRELEDRGIETAAVVEDAERRTTTKLRIVTERNQQVARVDYETDHDLAVEVERAVLERLEGEAARAQAVVVSDYLKGAITRDVASRTIATGRARDLPVIVDPKIPHLDYYAGATLVTPNHLEAQHAARLRIRTTDEARAAARAVRRQAGCASVLITRGEHGMWLLDGTSGSGDEADAELALPAHAREVADVTGAGDTVVGTLALALAAGARLSEAAALANYAASLVVGKFGPAVITPQELMRAVDDA
jgi:D-beta-D-heptose 7-phosphate kinase/D-beta-D-heptose 1-phosphate adenosyltransferase